MASGGGSSLRHMLAARARWTGDFEYQFQAQSSLVGAAMLGQAYLADDVGVLWRGGGPTGVPAPDLAESRP